MLNVVVARTPWTRRIFVEDIEPLSGEWAYVETSSELADVLENTVNVRRVYFIHWSDRVPTEITAKYECVNFHMTDLPFGRGGSPLQNLILASYEETVLAAIRMNDDLDAGPVYLKRRLPLHGSAEAVYARAGRLAAQMIEEIDAAGIEPVPQEGTPSHFRRRRPDQSEMPPDLSLSGVYDYIRMLDAPGYPCAFLMNGGLRFEFRRAVLYAESVVADVLIRQPEEPAT
jgi:methionyl-tRNA formyltransferase